MQSLAAPLAGRGGSQAESHTSKDGLVCNHDRMFFERIELSRALRGGSNWSAVPPEKLPPPQLWNKLIPGTVL